MHYVYILQSLKDGKLYTGSTNNIKRRITEHKNGKNISTKNRRPLKLIYCEIYLSKEDAEDREKYLKTSMGKRVIKKQLNHYLKNMNKHNNHQKFDDLEDNLSQKGDDKKKKKIKVSGKSVFELQKIIQRGKKNLGNEKECL